MFEFDDTLDDLFEDSVLPSDGDVFITPWNGRVIVSRCRYLDNGLWSWDQCLNWEELEADAISACNDTENGPVLGDLYRCPEHIAVRAAWASVSEEYAMSMVS